MKRNSEVALVNVEEPDEEGDDEGDDNEEEEVENVNFADLSVVAAPTSFSPSNISMLSNFSQVLCRHDFFVLA